MMDEKQAEEMKQQERRDEINKYQESMKKETRQDKIQTQTEK
jgi:hypothetical protein